MKRVNQFKLSPFILYAVRLNIGVKDKFSDEKDNVIKNMTQFEVIDHFCEVYKIPHSIKCRLNLVVDRSLEKYIFSVSCNINKITNLYNELVNSDLYPTTMEYHYKLDSAVMLFEDLTDAFERMDESSYVPFERKGDTKVVFKFPRIKKELHYEYDLAYISKFFYNYKLIPCYIPKMNISLFTKKLKIVVDVRNDKVYNIPNVNELK